MKLLICFLLAGALFTACNNTSDNGSAATDSLPAITSDSAAKLNSGNTGTGMGTDSLGLMNKGSHDSLTGVPADTIHH